MSRDIYLESTPLHEALAKWLERLDSEGVLRPLPGERVKVVDSLGRVTAEAVTAKISSPFYHSSAMDGYAVRFAETFGASERTPKRLKIGQEAAYVDTGDPVPEGFNLSQNYPNPFNPTTSIKVSLEHAGVMSLTISNVLGQLVKVVDEGYKAAGTYEYNVSMDQFASGVYFYSLQQGPNLITKKMLLLK